MAKEILSEVAGLRAGFVSPGRPRSSHAFSGASLCRMVEGDIIPRLLMAHRRDPHCAPARLSEPDNPDTILSAADVERFATLPLHQEANELLEEIEQYLARGITAERIFVELLAPSARTLGELWEDDQCDFVDVTMGLWRLQEVMRIVAMRAPAVMRIVGTPPSALFATMPGDQHSFGALMIEETFARAGWESEVLFEPKGKEILGVLAGRSFDLVGLTVTNDCPSADLTDLVSAFRSVSRNPAIRVIIGGRAINADPAIVAKVGADGTAPDAASVLVLAEQLVAEGRLVLGQV